MVEAGAPRAIGRYLLHGVLSSGGMATVHLGRLLGGAGFQRTVAIKRMHPQFASDPEFAAMFLEEARLAGRIRHPNVVSVIDVVALADEMLLVMEYVEGESLGRLVRAARKRGEFVPPSIASAIVCDALEGLQAAHEARDEKGQPLGVVHRDVSPQNIIVGADGVARVLDFGIAKASGSAQVTREGQLKGKLAYMAPEQLRGVASPKIDIHAMGIVLWETLTGARLFAGENEGATVTKVLQDVPAAPGTLVELPPGFDAVALKALAKNPAERYATAREMAVALAACGRNADPHEVAAWVQRIAKDVLEARAEIVSSVETAPSMQLGAAPMGSDRPSRRGSNAPTRADLSSDLSRGRSARSPAALVIAVSAAAVLAVTLGIVVIRGSRTPSPSAAAGPSVTVSSVSPTPSATASAADPATQLPAAVTTAEETSAASASASLPISHPSVRPHPRAVQHAPAIPSGPSPQPQPPPVANLPEHL